jgi:hypothetical protein
MKKTTHTAGAKSYARWSEELVSPFLLFKKFAYFFLTFQHWYFF